jgi:hypothetical protein
VRLGLVEGHRLTNDGLAGTSHDPGRYWYLTNLVKSRASRLGPPARSPCTARRARSPYRIPTSPFTDAVSFAES